MIEAVASCPDERWLARCPDEGRTVAATARHIARGRAFLGGLVRAIAAGEPVPPVTQEAVDRANAAAAERERADRGEALALPRADGDRAVATLRALRDGQLGRTATLLGREMSVAELIEDFLIAHPEGHVRGIRAARRPPGR